MELKKDTAAHRIARDMVRDEIVSVLEKYKNKLYILDFRDVYEESKESIEKMSQIPPGEYRCYGSDEEQVKLSSLFDPTMELTPVDWSSPVISLDEKIILLRQLTGELIEVYIKLLSE